MFVFLAVFVNFFLVFLNKIIVLSFSRVGINLLNELLWFKLFVSKSSFWLLNLFNVIFVVKILVVFELL